MSDSARSRKPPPTATQRALGLLVRREHSRKELSRKLVARGVEADEAAAAIAKLSEAGWQDDARFAELLVRSRAASGHGPVHVRAELRMHGLDSDAVAAAMEGFDGDWNAIARDLVRRRLGAQVAKDPAQQRRAADLLLRRGFAMDQVRAALGGVDFDD
ncbi:regulatory protein RecX [Pseudoluteimonas lycopersici]|uniref:Regulatory protein RecX n=1 Tax=Pseudoluteimonas lycopersici TaxID=1324796 RepID=A0A516V3V8_9GAMM|nr:regulatory protein RecX [Lysobacter lycopersici]QDQ73193.1 regulatory protein RecX [Lysobacter lycopersici]